MTDRLEPVASAAPDVGAQADPWDALRAHTAARIAPGRAGLAMPTQAHLALGLAHAQARDAVHVALDAEALAPDCAAALGTEVLHVQSAAADRAAYLRRPDLGRGLDAASMACLADWRAAHPEPHDLLVVVGDGLSSLAVVRHAEPLLRAIRAGCPEGWRLGPLVIATQARVALGDDIGARLGSPLVAMVLGERPGLSSADGLGIYLTWAPRVGRTDAERNCISNVRDQGLPPAAAAARLWWLCTAARRLGRTGVALKDDSGTPLLEAGDTPPLEAERGGDTSPVGADGGAA